MKTFNFKTLLVYVLAIALASIAWGQDATTGDTGGDTGPVHLEKITGPKGTATARAAMYTVGDVPPVIGDFYWGNKGTCTVNSNPNGTSTMFHPGAAGLGFNWCMIVKPLPAPPYTIITRTQGHVLGKAASMGLVLFDMGTGKFIVYSMPGASDSGAAALAAWRMNGFTSYVGSPAGIVFNFTNALATGGMQAGTYVRLKDDGTLRTVAIAADRWGPWLTISATPNTDHMAGQWFGYALRGTGDNMASLMTLYHEEITTP